MASVLDSPRIVSSARELAIALDVSLRQCQRYLADGMPGYAGRYDVEECRTWVDRNVQKQDGGSGDLNDAKKRAEIRKLNAEAEAKEVKNLQLAGELVHRDDVLREVSELILRIKTRLEAVPDEIEMELPAEQRPQLKATVGTRIELILREMAGWQLEGEGDGGDEEEKAAD